MTARLDGVAVIFVNHHSESLIAPKIPGLQEAGADVIVVDNSGTFPATPRAQVVEPGGNVGFARGCNLALHRLAPGIRTVCFHNPDLHACIDVIDRLRLRLERQSRPGLVTPAIRVGGLVRRNGYHYPSPGRELVVGARAISAMGDRGTQHRQPGAPPAARKDRDRVGRGRRFGSGGLLVASPQALKAVDGFDEGYFLYAEDLDLWHRIGEHGYTTEVDASTIVDHDEGTGGRMAAADRELLRWLGVELFAERTQDEDWPAYRRAHRLLLPMLARQGGTLSGPVRQAWERGASPSAVQGEVRAIMGAVHAACPQHPDTVPLVPGQRDDRSTTVVATPGWIGTDPEEQPCCGCIATETAPGTNGA